MLESSLGVPTGCVRSYDGRTVGVFSEATMAKLWDSVGIAATARIPKA
jgi:hypothetical protein